MLAKITQGNQVTREQLEKFEKWVLKKERGDVSFRSMEEALRYLKKRAKKS